MEDGVLGSAFMLGFIVSSPLFAHFAFSVYPMRLMALGLLMWACATAAAGVALDYWMLLLARAFTGVGEASFICLAPPYILDIAPPHRKTVLLTQFWVALFYSAIILGYAAGFIYGEQTASLLGSWRWPFLIESIVMLPFILLAMVLEKDENLLPLADSEARPTFSSEMRSLYHNSVFVCVVLGSAIITFAVGGLGFWGNTLLKELLDISDVKASTTFGALTLGCGLMAVLTGSVLMDLTLNAAQKDLKEGVITENEFEVERTKVACRFAICSTTGGAGFGAMCVFVHSFPLFVLLLGCSEFMLFL